MRTIVIIVTIAALIACGAGPSQPVVDEPEIISCGAIDAACQMDWTATAPGVCSYSCGGVPKSPCRCDFSAYLEWVAACRYECDHGAPTENCAGACK